MDQVKLNYLYEIFLKNTKNKSPILNESKPNIMLKSYNIAINRIIKGDTDIPSDDNIILINLLNALSESIDIDASVSIGIFIEYAKYYNVYRYLIDGVYRILTNIKVTTSIKLPSIHDYTYLTSNSREILFINSDYYTNSVTGVVYDITRSNDILTIIENIQPFSDITPPVDNFTKLMSNVQYVVNSFDDYYTISGKPKLVLSLWCIYQIMLCIIANITCNILDPTLTTHHIIQYYLKILKRLTFNITELTIIFNEEYNESKNSVILLYCIKVLSENTDDVRSIVNILGSKMYPNTIKEHFDILKDYSSVTDKDMYLNIYTPPEGILDISLIDTPTNQVPIDVMREVLTKILIDFQVIVDITDLKPIELKKIYNILLFYSVQKKQKAQEYTYTSGDKLKFITDVVTDLFTEHKETFVSDIMTSYTTIINDVKKGYTDVEISINAPLYEYEYIFIMESILKSKADKILIVYNQPTNNAIIDRLIKYHDFIN